MKKRKDDRYEQKITINGKRVTFYGKTKNELSLKVTDYKNKIEKGRTFGEVADEWEEKHEMEITHNAMRPLKTSKNRIMKTFKNTLIKSITPTQVSNYLLSYIDKNKPAHKTAVRELSVFNMVFKHAIINGDLTISPSQYVTVPKNLTKTKRELPSNADLKRILESTDCTFGLFAYFLLFTGLRRGEALAIRYEDIDRENNTITVKRAVDYRYNKPHLKAPKTTAGFRVVPLLDSLKKVLPDIKEGYVFPDGNGDLLTYRKFKNLWGTYSDESGVQCNRQSIRHATATMLFEVGVSVKDAQSILGHADITTTQNIYTHVRESRQKSVKKEIDDNINAKFLDTLK